jgi:iron(III) transport system ATP-binding protein
MMMHHAIADAPGAAGARMLRTAGLRVQQLTHRYGDRVVVSAVDLELAPGEVHCLVGPSGCGKTTTLRLIAGLEAVQAGTIEIGGRLVARPGFDLPPEERRVGLMFQDFALFPHLRVADNVGFGLRGLDRATRDQRVRRWLQRVNMSGYARAWPHTLSGGEQQRVALARALAPEPALMLLDEAFSALDTSLRATVRDEALAVLREAGTPTLLVTHDAEEAVRVGDRIHAMREGRIIQAGTPAELYARPADPFVAGFFGPVNRFLGRVRAGRVSTPVGEAMADALPEGLEVETIVRPEAIRVRPVKGRGVRARILQRRDLGPVHVIHLGLPGGSDLRVRQSGAIAGGIGDEVEIELDPSHLFVYPAAR